MVFVLVLTAVLGGAYAYVVARLAADVVLALAIAVPFALVWLVPVVYWGRGRESRTPLDRALLATAYVAMGWLSFLLVLTVARDLTMLLAAAFGAAGVQAWLADAGPAVVLIGSVAAVVLGAVLAARGPRLVRVEVPVAGLAPDLEGFRIALISDLHIGPTIHRPYVERVVRMTQEAKPDLVALTGDIVDGSVDDLGPHAEPLDELAAGGRAFFVTGNHEYYAGAQAWIERFRDRGFRVLLNEHELVERGRARLLVGGVVDPAVRIADRDAAPDCARAAGQGVAADFRLLLAHNPKLAPAGARAGFDLQLSGHTHAGQFIPWTLVVQVVHRPHAAGLSRSGRMQVYVSAGTGTWGPPIRLGTRPELTVLTLVGAGTT